MEKIEDPRNGIDVLKNYWNGYGKLTVSYLGFGIFGGFIIYLIFVVGGLFILPFAYEEGKSVLESELFKHYILDAYGVLFVYQLFVWVPICRNAKNFSHRIWAT